MSEARQTLERAIRLNPYERGAYYQLAQVFTRSGDEEKARKTLEVWKQLDPASVEVATQGGNGTPLK